MRVLVVGRGAREHALAWRLSVDAGVEQVFVAPGNPGVETIGTRLAFQESDTKQLVEFARREAIDLTVAGAEAPLVDGIADRFQDAGLTALGPCAAAARLEGSKVLAKELMDEAGIPTAAWRAFDDPVLAAAWLERHPGAWVVKADGLAAGKGVFVTDDTAGGRAAVEALMVEQRLGEAGTRVVIEERLAGTEASYFCLTDGSRWVTLPTSQDHKRLLDGDQGAMTGGMGAVSPSPELMPSVVQAVESSIVAPTLAALAARGTPYRGFLYVGLMLTAAGPRVLEYNCRLGDPEAQVILPLIGGHLADALMGAAHGSLTAEELACDPGAAACVVAAAPGYPEHPAMGLAIEGASLHSFEEGADGSWLFHAGTGRDAQGQLVTAGGRVLSAAARAPTVAQALDLAYARLKTVHFDGMQFRRDIGQRALAALEEVERV